MIEIEHLTKLYGNHLALDDFNLSVRKGDVVGLVGPNGSGKSTLIKILTTLLRPTSGRAAICGFDVVKQSMNVKKVIGYVPEKVSMWNELNAYENLYYWGKIMGMEPAALKPRIKVLLKELKLEGKRKVVSKFSKGMMQRVAIGMALLHSPDVLILDEPTSGLDPDGRLILREIVRLNAEHGKTILFSTHELLEAEKACVRVAFINEGKLRGFGDPTKDNIEKMYKEVMA